MHGIMFSSDIAIIVKKDSSQTAKTKSCVMIARTYQDIFLYAKKVFHSGKT